MDHLRTLLLLALGSFLCLTTSQLRAQEPLPDPAQLLQQALAAGEAFRKQLPGLEYDAAVRVDEFDQSGALRGTGKATMLVRPGADPEVTYLSREKQGQVRLPDDKPSQHEEDKEETTVPEFAAKHQVAERYKFTVEGRDSIAGEPSYRVAFSPKPDQPAKNSVDRFLEAVAGHAWVTEKESRLVKFEMRLQHPHELFWLLAVLKEFSFRYELLEPGEILGRAQIRFRFYLSTPIWSLRQEHVLVLDHFRPRPLAQKAKTTSR